MLLRRYANLALVKGVSGRSGTAGTGPRSFTGGRVPMLEAPMAATGLDVFPDHCFFEEAPSRQTAARDRSAADPTDVGRLGLAQI
jgi:hypothetical protein